MYFVVLVLRLWADCALELGQAHQHTVLAGSALLVLICAPSNVVQLVLL